MSCCSWSCLALRAAAASALALATSLAASSTSVRAWSRRFWRSSFSVLAPSRSTVTDAKSFSTATRLVVSRSRAALSSASSVSASSLMARSSSLAFSSASFWAWIAASLSRSMSSLSCSISSALALAAACSRSRAAFAACSLRRRISSFIASFSWRSLPTSRSSALRRRRAPRAISLRTLVCKVTTPLVDRRNCRRTGRPRPTVRFTRAAALWNRRTAALDRAATPRAIEANARTPSRSVRKCANATRRRRAAWTLVAETYCRLRVARRRPRYPLPTRAAKRTALTRRARLDEQRKVRATAAIFVDAATRAVARRASRASWACFRRNTLVLPSWASWTSKPQSLAAVPISASQWLFTTSVSPPPLRGGRGDPTAA
mmetsp:Transcript_20776/g.66864  ORF Transcript_20776/g.66864 Transcript_20776/m.66864 type:complete len:375 (-) Transcript_20776:336-1460(-)